MILLVHTAVLKRGCHNHVTSCDVREGSFVILTSYRLSKGRKLSGSGSVIYVIIEDFYSIGEEPRENVHNERHDRYNELIKTPNSQSMKQLDGRLSSEIGRRLHEGAYDGYGYEQYNQQHKKEENYSFWCSSPESSRELTVEMKKVSPRAASAKSPKFAIASPSSKQQSRRRDEPLRNISYDSSRHHILDTNEVDKRQRLFEALSHSEEKNRKRNENFTEFDPAIDPRDIKIMRLTTESSATPVKINRIELPARLEWNNKIASKHVGVDLLVARKKIEMPQSLDLPRNLERVNPKYLALHPSTAKSLTASVTTKFTGSQGLLAIKTPLRICTLESLTGRNATRNKVHDVFAIVCSVQECVVKPPKNMPRKRDIRIMDPSTDKKVLVSVFVDPDNFKPIVGTVALFRNLTTHEWDSGMLNVYHDKCAGKAWFIKDPVDVEGCDVKALKEWWEKKNSEREDSNVKVLAEKT